MKANIETRLARLEAKAMATEPQALTISVVEPGVNGGPPIETERLVMCGGQQWWERPVLVDGVKRWERAA